MKYILPLFLTLIFSLKGFGQQTNRGKSAENHKMVSDTVKDKKVNHLDEVFVNGNPKQKPAAGTRSTIKPMDLPQTIQIIGATIIEQQQAIRLGDVIKNANGVYVTSTRGATQEAIYSRGYNMVTNNLFKNGFRYNGGSIPEIYSLEKVEVLKGNAALLYGNVTPGGILNMVSKAPTFTKGLEIVMQTGSHAFYKPAIDIHGPLNKYIAYRFIGTYENSESFRDVVKRERYYINPSILFKASKKTEILLQGDYLKDDWTPDFGTGVIGQTIIDLPRNLYLGATWSNGQTKQASISATVKHNFNKNWQLNFNTALQNFSRQFKGTERTQADATGKWSRPLGESKNLEQITGEQLTLQGNFLTGKLKHELATGIDSDNSFSEAYTFAFSPTTYGSGNVFDFDNFNQGGAIPNSNTTKIAKTNTNRFGIYLQDLITITEQFKLLAGLRWSWQEYQVTTQDLTKKPLTITEDPKRKEQAFSPKIGLVFQPTKQMSLFASYSNSFSPNSGYTYDNKPLDPSIIDQYEVGIKNLFFGGILSTNLTLYKIINSNLDQTAQFKADGITPNSDQKLKILSGETKSEGIEFEITAKPIEGLGIMAGYSYNDMRYTKTSGLKDSFIEGDLLTKTLPNSANLSFFYTFPSGSLKGFSFGAIGNYIGKRLGGFNNLVGSTSNQEIPLEEYTTIDTSIGYNWKQFSILCKLSNITNELNYLVHENSSVNPIAPRQVMSTIRYKF